MRLHGHALPNASGQGRLKHSPPVSELEAASYRIPTDTPEADGTLRWNATTLVVVHACAADEVGVGYSYTDRAAASLIEETLKPCVLNSPAFDTPACWNRMAAAVRNLGRPGLCAMAISAVDTALWDLKARLLGVPLVDLLGTARESVPIYGSGGFTSYADERLTKQMQEWADCGIQRIKMKVGADPDSDLDRVQGVRRRVGPDVQLFVDANGAYSAKQALSFAESFAAEGVVWLEEPVSSDDLAGLRLVRERAPPGMDIAAGEYGFDEFYFRRMLDARAVDVLQADVTRCCGLTGFVRADALARASNVPLSSHCAPALHVHACCASANVRHIEYFYDHVRIERMLFDGAPEPRNGQLTAQRDRAGCGLTLRRSDAERYRT